MAAQCSESVLCTGTGMERIAFQVQGRDRPGVTQMMIECLSNHEKDGLTLVDISQIVVNGFLMESFVCDVKSDRKYDIQKDLLYTCQESEGDASAQDGSTAMSLQWSLVPTSVRIRPTKRKSNEVLRIIIQIVAKQQALAPEMVRAVGRIASEQGANIHSVEQEEIILNKEVAQSLRFQLEAPPSGSRAVKELFLDLKKFCWGHQAECVVRQFDTLTMAKPKQRSLIVFGLSQVLINSDILDDMVEVWLSHPDCTITREEADKVKELANSMGSSKDRVHDIIPMKLGLLRGAPEEIIETTRQRIVFTKNVRQVCGALKSLGYKMALITSSTPRSIAVYVKQELGLDYALSHDMELDENQRITGRMVKQSSPKTLISAQYLTSAFQKNVILQKAGTFRKDADADYDPDFLGPMRKVELMRLLADKEKIDKTDIIVIGNYVHPDALFEHAGFQVHYNSTTFEDMTVMLYLFGFRATEVEELMAMQAHQTLASSPSRRLLTESSTTKFTEGPENARTFDFRIVGPDEQGFLSKIMDSLCKEEYKGHVSISRLSASSIFCGMNRAALVLAFQIVDATKSSSAVKDLLFDAQLYDMQVHVQQVNEDDCASDRGATVIDAINPRLIVSIIKEPYIQAVELVLILNKLQKLNVNIEKLNNLSLESNALAALELTVTGEEKEPGHLLALLQNAMWGMSQELQIDIAVQNNDVVRFSRRVIVFDMDSTLIQQEVIDELARYGGVMDEVSKITEAAMRGEINFAESLRQRCVLLAGNNASQLFDKVKSNLIFTPGAKTLCRTLKRIGYTMAVISGGFLPVARYVQEVLQLDYAFANELEIDDHGLLTGKTFGAVVTPQRKRMLMSMISEVESCSLDQVIAVGDGANDIPMLQAAGLGVAFCAKPRVQNEARYRINNTDLRTVAFLLGISSANIEQHETVE